MKPLKLTMKAFGPYAGNQVIDFSELKGRSMFLIHGKTGSGKTTILDGICYALYGETSGNERDGRSMRSQFADMSELTEVELEFELRSQKYKIKRIPQQERLKKSGMGTTIQNPEAYLWKLDEDKETVLEASPLKVDKRIRELLGFECKQFRQVIMIPQGEFRKLLTARSEERQEILEKIFHTEIYRNIEQFLKDKTRVIKNEIIDKKKQQKWILGRLQSDERTILETLTETEDPDIDRILSEVSKVIEMDTENFKDINNRINEKEKEIKLSIHNLNKAKESNDKLEEKKQAIKNYNDKLCHVEEYEKLKASIEKSRKALTLIEIEKIAYNRSLEKDSILKDIKLKEQKIEDLKNIYIKAKEKLDEENSKEGIRKEADRKAMEFEKYTGMVNQLENSKVEISFLENRVKSFHENIKTHEAKIIELQRKLDEALKKLDEARYSETRYIEVSQLIKQKEEIYERKKELSNMEKTFKKEEKIVLDLKNGFLKAEQKYSLAKREYEAYQDMWNKGQAGIIAEGLQEGIPCPVCGSTVHPCLAHLEKGVPSESELKTKKEIMLQFEKEKEVSKNKLDNSLLKSNTMKVSVDTLTRELGESVFTDDNLLSDEIVALKLESDELDKIIKNASELVNIIEKTKVQINKTLSESESLKQQFTELNEEYQSKSGAVNQLLSSIPEDLRSLKALEAALDSARENSKKLKNALEKSRKDYDSISAEFLKEKTSLEEASKLLKSIDEKYKNEKQAFKTSLEQAGFQNYNDYAFHKKSQEEIIILDRKLKDFEGMLHAAKDRLDRANKAAEDLEYADVSLIQSNMDENQKERDLFIKKQNSLKRRIEDNINCIKDITNIENAIKSMEEQYALIGELSETANGKNSYGITFQRFVLSALLDDILEKSNYRLKRMSSGRYELYRTMDRERKNAQSGLDLEVFDNDTGMARNVSTLSGGEGFIASLSLALGLADVVQAYSGGISLDTMFIDEGFGTLDPESLDYAIRTLIDLQQGGRLVGIISHVPELKERIDARLEVVSTNCGSYARFEVL